MEVVANVVSNQDSWTNVAVPNVAVVSSSILNV